VDANDTVRIRSVTVGDTVGSKWVVTSGVNPGERVVAEGVQKIRQGMQVKPKAYQVK